MSRKNIFLSLLVSIALIACVSEENENKSDADQVISEAIDRPQDTIAVNVMFMEVMGNENLLRGPYKSGQSEEEFLKSVTDNDKYKDLVAVKVPGFDETDSSMTDDELDQTGTVQSSSRVYQMLEYSDENVDQPFRVSVVTKVKDFETWKILYQNEAKNRENAGMKQLQLGVAMDDPNLIFMLIAIPDIAKAREMMVHPGLKKRMAQSGVIGTPEVKFWRLAGPQSEHY